MDLSKSNFIKHYVAPCLLAFTLAAQGAYAQDADFAHWNDGDNAAFRNLIDTHIDDIRKWLGRIPFSGNDYIDYFGNHPDESVRAAFSQAYGPVQHSTNCYAFAVNDYQGHDAGKKPSPGRASGFIVPGVRDEDGAEIAYYAELDGLKPASTETEHLEGHYRVALVISPNDDYHWYRENADGTWSHKRGHEPVTNKDAANQIITDPQKAARDYSSQGGDNYSHFYGFFHVPEGGIELNTIKAQKPTVPLRVYKPQ